MAGLIRLAKHHAIILLRAVTCELAGLKLIKQTKIILDAHTSPMLRMHMLRVKYALFAPCAP